MGPLNIPSIFFKSTALKGTGKLGILRPNDNGYYRMPLGALNVFNSVGQYYTVDGARELFEGNSSPLQRRLQDNCLYGELGHPIQLPGQSDAQYVRRCRTIQENNQIVHILKVELDFNSVKDEKGKPVIAIMGEIRPSGPHAHILEQALKNPNENACFSIRSFSTKTIIGGITHFKMVEVITWDKVTEPGIEYARKYYAPTLESFAEKEVFPQTLRDAILTPTSTITSNNMLVTHEQRDLEGRALLRTLGWELNSTKLPLSMRW
jgi:hypothetical protein